MTVVVVLTINCQVSEKPKIGPDAAQAMMEKQARAKTAGCPDQRATLAAAVLNQSMTSSAVDGHREEICPEVAGSLRCLWLGRLQDAKALDLLEQGQVRPAVAVMQDDQPVQVAADLRIDAIHGLQLFPDAADAVGQRHI